MDIALAYFNIKSLEDINYKYDPKISLIDNLPEHSFIIIGDVLIVTQEAYIKNKDLVLMNAYSMDRQLYKALTFGSRYGSTMSTKELAKAATVDPQYIKAKTDLFFNDLATNTRHLEFKYGELYDTKTSKN